MNSDSTELYQSGERPTHRCPPHRAEVWETEGPGRWGVGGSLTPRTDTTLVADTETRDGWSASDGPGDRLEKNVDGRSTRNSPNPLPTGPVRNPRVLLLTPWTSSVPEPCPRTKEGTRRWS